MAIINKTESEKRKKLIITRISVGMLISFLVAGSFIGLKSMINKDYKAKQSIVHDQAINGVTYEGTSRYFKSDDWYYLGMGDTDLRPKWSMGGYMVNVYALAYDEANDMFFLGVLTMDDQVKGKFRDKYDIREEKGNCKGLVSIHPDLLQELYANHNPVGIIDQVLHQEFCGAHLSRFIDTPYSHSWNSLHLKRSIKDVLEKAGINIKKPESE